MADSANWYREEAEKFFADTDAKAEDFIPAPGYLAGPHTDGLPTVPRGRAANSGEVTWNDVLRSLKR